MERRHYSFLLYFCLPIVLIACAADYVLSAALSLWVWHCVALYFVCTSFFLYCRVRRAESFFTTFKDIIERNGKGRRYETTAHLNWEPAVSIVREFHNLNHRMETKVEELGDEVQRYKKIVKGLQEGIILLGVDRRILFLNEAGAALNNIDITKVKGRKVEEVLRISGLLRFVDRLFLSEHSVREETIVCHLEAPTYLKLYGRRFEDTHSGQKRVLVVMSDVTQLHLLERMRRDFVANVSHELKTPVTSIKGSVETLLDGAIENREDAQMFLLMISRQITRLHEIIEDLLQLSRMQIESDRQTIERERVSISELTKRVAEHCRFQAHRIGVDVEFLCPDSLEWSLNESLFQQVLTNLIDNAVKSSIDGARVSVTIEQQGDKLSVVVADNGVGIAQEHLSRIFERFYRVDYGRGRDQGGSGLGLAIVKHIVQAHGGEISVESAVGKGTTFFILVPSK